MILDIIITTNAPGELLTWVKPVILVLNKEIPSSRIIIALVPCPFSSGLEYNVASEFPEISCVLTPEETIYFLLKNKLPVNKYFSLSKQGLVLHLGGDQFFSLLLAKRTKFPLIVYTEKFINWHNFVDKFLLIDQQSYTKKRLKGIPHQKLCVVGNLMVDAVQTTMDPRKVREQLNLKSSMPIISLLPGSKPFKVKYLTPLLLKISDEIRKKDNNIQFVIHRSIFTPLEQLEESITNEKYRKVTNGTKASLFSDKSGDYIITENGTKVVIIPPSYHYNGIQISDICLTTPGTNTAELAILGIPMIILLPLNKPEIIPLEGILGRIGDIPYIGKLMKIPLIKYTLKKIKFTSLPNIKSNMMIVPEFIGNIDINQVVDNTIDLLNDHQRRREISINLRKIMGNKGAAFNVVNQIKELMIKNYPCLRNQLEYKINKSITK